MEPDPLYVGKIYLNQRGAGCGKTFESIQLLQEERFQDKDTFVYLTKMHSAKEVIYQELQAQERRGALSELEPIQSLNGKQYEITYFHRQWEKTITILIGTIDSFTYAVVDKAKLQIHSDYFYSLVDALRQGHLLLHPVRYAGQLRNINRRCLVVIDEAQDLGPDYLLAFQELIQQRQLDVFIIGDKLQSIWGEHNIFTYMDDNNHHTLPLTNEGEKEQKQQRQLCVIREPGINRVMRFHHQQFQTFVNQMIPFAKYQLPPISGICPGGSSCKYHHDEENDQPPPYELFPYPTPHNKDDDTFFKEMDQSMEFIWKQMDQEIDDHQYLPEHFMFIFPILSNNSYASTLEIRLQKYWLQRMETPSYQLILSTQSEFWNSHIAHPQFPNQFYKYVHLHKSDDGSSINLQESIHATRILSIHSSKGQGCEVVFLLGMNESTLRVFSKEKNNLMFDSLVHVAITRQKKKLFIGVSPEQDEITHRLSVLSGLPLPVGGCKRGIIKLRASRLKQFLLAEESHFIPLYERYITLFPVPEKRPTTGIIDMGYHIIRFNVMILCLTLCALQHDHNRSSQLFMVLEKVTSPPVILTTQQEYVKCLRMISKYQCCAKKGQTPSYRKGELVLYKKSRIGRIISYDETSGKYRLKFDKAPLPTDCDATTLSPYYQLPVLQFTEREHSKYYKYAHTLRTFMIHIQLKIKDYLDQQDYTCLPPLCALEFLILQFMLRMYSLGFENDISILEIYSILYCYDECANSITESHAEGYHCLCYSSFSSSQTDTTSSTSYHGLRSIIVEHFNTMNKIKQMFEYYSQQVYERFGVSGSEIKYNVNHSIHSGDFDNMYYTERYSLIGHSFSHVFCFILHPQFTELNVNRIMVEAVVDHYLLSIQEQSKNAVRFGNQKTICLCVFTFDSTPMLVVLPSQPHDVLYSGIISHVEKEFHTQHVMVYSYLQWMRETHAEWLLHPFEQMERLLRQDKNNICSHAHGKNKLHDLPEYIREYFTEIINQMDDDPKERSTIEEKHLQQDYLCGRLLRRLQFKIKRVFPQQAK